MFSRFHFSVALSRLMPLWEGRTVLLTHFSGYDIQAHLGKGFVSTGVGFCL